MPNGDSTNGKKTLNKVLNYFVREGGNHPQQTNNIVVSDSLAAEEKGN
jgi:hypothetical protein